MAVKHHVGEPQEQEDQYCTFLLDALYCEEDQQTWEDQEEEEEEEEEEKEDISEIILGHNHNECPSSSSSFPLLCLHNQDLSWEDEELVSLFSKEKTQQKQMNFKSTTMCKLLETRKEGVEWMMKVSGYYGFSTLTGVLAVNYLDRFLFTFVVETDDDDDDKPWMIQLVAVACISLAAKVEETHVPFLLDLQVGDNKYVFEAKTIQRMELLVMSTLEWKMHPVTPIAFLDHIFRRLGLKYVYYYGTHSHWDFLRKCERLILSFVSDSRCSGHRYLPSVVAAATMMHVIEEVQPCNSNEYKSHLLEVLQMDMDKVKECYQLIGEVVSSSRRTMTWTSSRPGATNGHGHKRKYDIFARSTPSCPCPGEVIEATLGSDSVHDNSNDSWSSPTKKFRPSSSPSSSHSQSHASNNNNNNNKMPLASLNPPVVFSGHP